MKKIFALTLALAMALALTLTSAMAEEVSDCVVQEELNISDGCTELVPELNISDGCTELVPELNISDGCTELVPELNISDGFTEFCPELNISDGFEEFCPTDEDYSSVANENGEEDIPTGKEYYNPEYEDSFVSWEEEYGFACEAIDLLPEGGVFCQPAGEFNVE